MKNNKRGFTLVELCVTMSLIALVGALITTFFILMKDRSAKSERQNAVVDDISSIETYIKRWIRIYDNSDYRFQVVDNRLVAYDTVGTFDNKSDDIEKSSLYLKPNEALMEGVNESGTVVDKAKVFETKSVNAVSFYITTDQSSKGHNIIYSDVYYVDADTNEEQQIRFMFTTFAQNYN